MGLRADVIHELKALDTSTKAMRKFGLKVGAVFIAIAAARTLRAVLALSETKGTDLNAVTAAKK